MSEHACRIIVEPQPQSGAANMATDAALLQAADEEPAAPIVRIYQWEEPTVSLGYFQKSTPPLASTLAECPQVRRLTGGGAILHDDELTYSCVVPRNHRLHKEPVRLYEVMHQAISELLTDCGVSSGFRIDHPLRTLDTGTSGDQPEPFLCFLRSDPRDLAATPSNTMERPKIVGSAQRRRRGTVLQHGSILMRASRLLPLMTGIHDLFPYFDAAGFAGSLADRLAASISPRNILSEYTDRERQLTFKLKNQQQYEAESRRVSIQTIAS